MHSRLLRMLARGPVDLDLRELLTPFIRERLNQHNECSDPNCYHAAPAVNCGSNVEPRHVTAKQLLIWLADNYRFVRPDEDPRVGDLMLYAGRDEPNQPVTIAHAATFVTSEIVFTKNGYSRFVPYTFQYARRNEAFYFPDGRYRLTLFRPTRAGEVAAGAAVFGRHPYRYEHPDLEFAEIDYSEGEPRTLRCETELAG